MIEKPNLADESIIAGLRQGFAIDASEVKFLPIGNDSSAWVYRVGTSSETNYFLKVKKGRVYPPALSVPRYLQDQGIPQVVAPLPARAGGLWKRLGDFALILYPYIEGRTGMEQGLTRSQWAEFGRVLKHIHATTLLPNLSRQVRKENFSPYWSATVRRIDHLIEENTYQQPVERELARFWLSKRTEIRKIVDRTEELGQRLRKVIRSAQFILCHTDIHTANVLIDPNGGLHIVDWDQPLLAPKERDLMFMVGNASEGLHPATPEQGWFFSGYGQTEINPLALAYYHYEWVVQEIGDDGERVFLTPGLGEETKKAALEDFMALFEPGNVVESAYRAGQELF